MTRYENPIEEPTDAADHIDLIRNTLQLNPSVTISCKPQDIDRTKIEILDIFPHLSTPQKEDLIDLYPELDNKEV